MKIEMCSSSAVQMYQNNTSVEVVVLKNQSNVDLKFVSIY